MLYSETTEIIPFAGSICDTTRKTFTIESNDDDFLNFSDFTTITKTSEAKDDDYIHLASHHSSDDLERFTSTLVTRSLENDDTVYFQASTIKTNTVESSDEDFITFL